MANKPIATFYFEPTKPAKLSLVVELGDEVHNSMWVIAVPNRTLLVAREVLRGPITRIFPVELRDPVTVVWEVGFESARTDSKPRLTGQIYLLLNQEGESPKLLAGFSPRGRHTFANFSVKLLPAWMKGPREPHYKAIVKDDSGVIYDSQVLNVILEPLPRPRPPPMTRKMYYRTPYRSPAKRRQPARDTRTARTTERTDLLYRVWFGTNRQPAPGLPTEAPFTNERDDVVHHGYCDVFIPRSHKIGSLGSPLWKRILKGDDRVTLRHISELSERKFWRQLAEACQLAPEEERQAVVYLHGYNTSFREAARRTAQLGCDLSIQGAMGFFSWPSKGSRRRYIPDTAAIESSEEDIANFLAGFAAQSGSDRVHVIAHSMGNRGLLRAISRIVGDARKLSRCRFTHLVLAAPDVDTKVFRDLAANFEKVAKRATLYVSDKDVLLEASRWLHDYPRAGIRPPVTILPHVDTIDVGKVDLSFLGHSYVAATRAVITDIHGLLHNDATPRKRMGLEEVVTPAGAKYWAIRA